MDNLLWVEYGEGDALIVLSILYPWADLRNNFHIDHFHPKTKFTKNKLKRCGVPENKIEFCLDNYNYLGNLQLLEEIPNKEKNARLFDKWIMEQFPDPVQRKDYMRKHYIPDVDLSIENFEEFLDERDKLLTTSLKKELM